MIAPALAPATLTQRRTGLSGCSANPHSAPASAIPFTPPPRKTPSASSIQSMAAILSHRRIGVERAGSMPPMAEDTPAKRRRMRRFREALRNADRHDVALAAVRALRRRLPGDERYGDPLSVGGHAPAELLGARLALLAGESPSALKELGFGALQVWQSVSEAQGRGQGDRELAILFTDLAGFSTWALEAGDEMALDLLRRVGAAIEPCVAAHGGHVVKRLGDGLMAVFDTRATRWSRPARPAAAWASWTSPATVRSCAPGC